MTKPTFYTGLVLLLMPVTSAFAYVGPGAGLGAIAAAIAVVVGLILLIVGFFYFPLKRYLRQRKSMASKTSEELMRDE